MIYFIASIKIKTGKHNLWACGIKGCVVYKQSDMEIVGARIARRISMGTRSSNPAAGVAGAAKTTTTQPKVNDY